MVENKSNGLSKIHNVRFYNLTPRSINYLAYNKDSCKLAVSRLVFVFFWLCFGEFLFRN